MKVRRAAFWSLKNLMEQQGSSRKAQKETMRIYEIDWRRSSVAQILDAIGKGLAEIKTKIPYDDIDEVLEQWDSLLGIAFIAAQSYISGTVSDVNNIAKSSPKIKKDSLLADFSDLISGTTVTELQLCDAIANYFKHHVSGRIGTRLTSGRKQ